MISILFSILMADNLGPTSTAQVHIGLVIIERTQVVQDSNGLWYLTGPDKDKYNVFYTSTGIVVQPK